MEGDEEMEGDYASEDLRQEVRISFFLFLSLYFLKNKLPSKNYLK
jgi:hypothetical protein